MPTARSELRRAFMLALVGTAALVHAALAATPGPAAAPRRTPSPETPMAIDNALFDTVPLNQGVPHACSPKAPRDPWLGIVIQAPTEVGYRHGKPVDGQFAAIPVCGFYRLEMGRLLDGKPLMLVAVNLQDQTRLSGPMLDVDPGLMARRPPSEPVRPEDVAGMTTDAYFNPNLARYVKLPAIDAVWQVHAEYGGAVSNSVRISVVRR
jgi:hypothetical protein